MNPAHLRWKICLHIDSLEKLLALAQKHIQDEPSGPICVYTRLTFFTVADLFLLVESQWKKRIEYMKAYNPYFVFCEVDIEFHRKFATIWDELDDVIQCKLSNGVGIRQVHFELGISLAGLNKQIVKNPATTTASHSTHHVDKTPRYTTSMGAG
jgi:hypothetical protein